MKSYILFSCTFLFSISNHVNANTPNQTIKILNNNDQSLEIKHNIPAYTKALIFLELTRIKESGDNYAILELPENFLACDNGDVLNNHGNIAGYIWNKDAPPLSVVKPGLQTVFEKGHNCVAAVWVTNKGIISSGLKNSRGVSLNNIGFVAISRGSDIPNPDCLWDMGTNDLVFAPDWKNKIKTGGGQAIKFFTPNYNQFLPDGGSVMGFRIDSSEKGSHLSIKSNLESNPDMFLYSEGKNRLILFPHELFSNTKRFKTGLPSVNARLNGKDEVVALLKNGNDLIIGKWQKGGRVTTSEPLQNKPELKKYSSFAILGFNDKGQILIRADVNDMQQIEYKPIKPQLFLLDPSGGPIIESLNDFSANIKSFNSNSAVISVSGKSAKETLINLFVEFMKHPLFESTHKIKKTESCWELTYAFKAGSLYKNELQGLIDLASRHDYNSKR